MSKLSYPIVAGMIKIYFFMIFLIFYSFNVYGMAKTLVWECRVVQINDKIQTKGKINSYKIDVTTPMIWVRDDTRWSSLINTKFLYDKEIDILYSESNPWSGVFDLANQKIIFSNVDANLIVHYQCK